MPEIRLLLLQRELPLRGNFGDILYGNSRGLGLLTSDEANYVRNVTSDLIITDY